VKRILLLTCILLVACQQDAKSICTPQVLDEISNNAYRATVLAEANAQATVIFAERTATGLNAWYMERFRK
jgi:uncharacterized lipoprotein YbaY